MLSLKPRVITVEKMMKYSWSTVDGQIEKLLIYSGFVMKDNQYNNVIIRLELNDALARIRMLVLKRENILPTSFGNQHISLEQNGYHLKIYGILHM